MRAIILLLLLGAGAVALRAASTRDIVFVRRAACAGDVLDCAASAHFNGDWSGATLCRAGQCVRFDDIFKETR